MTDRATLLLVADTLVERLRERHEDYTGPLGCAWWRLARDAYQGTGGFRATVQTAQTGQWGDRDTDTDPGQPIAGSYLVRYPRETGGQFSRRQAVSTYTNYVAPILQEYAGHLWRRAPQRSATDAEVTRWRANVDGEGTGIDAWLESITRSLQLFGWVAVLVDRPAGDLTAAEAMTYARALDPEELVDWELDGRGRFVWARLCTSTETRDPFTGEEIEREVYTTWTATEWERVVLRESDEQWAVEEGPVRQEHSLGRVPISVLYWQEPVERCRLYGQSQADGLVSCALEHFNVASELREHERGQVFSILCVQSDDPHVWDGIKLGTHDGLRYGTDAAAPSYLAPPDSVGLYLSDRLKRVEERIYELAHLDKPSGQPQAESGVSRQWRFGQTRSVLCAATKRLQAGERDLLDIVLRWQYPDAAKRAEVIAASPVVYPEDFDVDDLATVLESRLAVLDKPAALVPETARAARLSIGRALNPYATPKEDTALVEQVEASYNAEVRQHTQQTAPKVDVAKVDPSTLTSFTLPFLSINEVRAALGAPGVEGGDAIAALTPAPVPGQPTAGPSAGTTDPAVPGATRTA